MYAAADDQRIAARAIGDLLSAYLEAHPGATARATIRVAAVSQIDQRVVVRLASVAAILGATTIRAKAKAKGAREDGRKGGRPGHGHRKAAASRE